MSRIAKSPITLPKGVEFKNTDGEIQVKGPKGTLSMTLHPAVGVTVEDGVLSFAPHQEADMAMAGTMRSLVNNMVEGVTNGYERKLALVGVGYRAAVQGNSLNLQLGFSHPVDFPVPDGVTIETPSQTEIVVRGSDKQLVGQVAAKIRAYRPPEPYKGKGVRYADERVVMKEAKKA
ncbi:50S ribosomal protein L6 [Wenzhouxiangella marina]|uniref:Large ribosomal subunit protein uL6 n=1 Tax=Wenzhouxiangella marina TaxID=1579979 RepID=A0A0K0XYD0_9GAMM|nr:50S ribosomal protein L6 [Wenzhouxiangella marina]AKS42637.1 50S ribosomal protein L6 [Wenzhouxiangella marina]MBB6085581.1 large subunit ribosomal protein L6 [Wenzhouxiangella marina]